jgi:hypothetical protein
MARRKGIPENMKPHQWKKGTSGNPKGRPKKIIPKLDLLLAEVLGGSTKSGEDSELKKVIEQLLVDAKNKSSMYRTRAAETLLDRVYGKPKEKVVIEDEGEAAERRNVVVNIISDPAKIKELKKRREEAQQNRKANDSTLTDDRSS